jgi:1,4-dihydroxy-2-naphthoate octaprenyltransferase
MSDGRRFEDTISIEDLMKKPVKELLVMSYMQGVKTNGTVIQNCNDIKELKSDIKLKANDTEVVELKKEMKDKIGMKLFAIITGIVGLLIVIFNVIARVIQ